MNELVECRIIRMPDAPGPKQCPHDFMRHIFLRDEVDRIGLSMSPPGYSCQSQRGAVVRCTCGQVFRSNGNTWRRVRFRRYAS